MRVVGHVDQLFVKRHVLLFGEESVIDRKAILVEELLGHFSLDVKKGAAEANDFFCGLHEELLTRN